MLVQCAGRMSIELRLEELHVVEAASNDPGTSAVELNFRTVDRHHALEGGCEDLEQSAIPRPRIDRELPRGKQAPAATLADVDLVRIKSDMAETIERAKADDPKALRAEIAALKRQMTDAVKAQVLPDPTALASAEARGAHAATERMQQHYRHSIGRMVAAANGGRERAASAIDQALSHLKVAADALREPIDVEHVFAAAGPAYIERLRSRAAGATG